MSTFEFLPAVEAVRLREPPLVQVIAEVRYNSVGRLTSPVVASEIHEVIADRYPRLLTEDSQTITAVAGGAITTSTVPQWRMADFSKHWSCVIGPDRLTLETSTYELWPVMRERLSEILDALTGSAKPRVRERIGLRYVNHIPPDEGGSHLGRIRSEVLGIAAIANWRLSASMSQTVFREDPLLLALRYGTGAGLVDPPTNFILEVDCADEAPQPFELDETLVRFDQLNDVIHRCFTSCLTEEYLRSLS